MTTTTETTTTENCAVRSNDAQTYPVETLAVPDTTTASPSEMSAGHGLRAGLAALLDLIDGVTVYPGWETRGRCVGMPTGWFYPNRGESLDEIRQVCQSCPVQAECLTTALTRPDRHGMWGGASERQRRDLRRHLRKQQQHEELQQELQVSRPRRAAA